MKSWWASAASAPWPDKPGPLAACPGQTANGPVLPDAKAVKQDRIPIFDPHHIIANGCRMTKSSIDFAI